MSEYNIRDIVRTAVRYRQQKHRYLPDAFDRIVAKAEKEGPFIEGSLLCDCLERLMTEEEFAAVGRGSA